MFEALTIKSRLTIVMGLLCLFLTGTGLLGLHSLSQVNSSLKSVYENRLLAMGRVEIMVHSLDLLRYSVATSANDSNAAAIDAKLARLKRDLGDGEKAWGEYAAGNLTGDEKARADEVIGAFHHFFEQPYSRH
ncbi:Tar ligand binding domain-containing protein [Paraburkholderia hospita]